jgi:hypothetical protein
MIFTIIAVAVSITVGNVLCFFLGAKITQQIYEGERVTVTIPNPTEVIRMAQEEREAEETAEAELNKMQTILDNIERYDGTPYGQKAVPEGVNEWT